MDLSSLQSTFSLEFTRLYLEMAHSARLQCNYAVATKYLQLTEAAITKVRTYVIMCSQIVRTYRQTSIYPPSLLSLPPFLPPLPPSLSSPPSFFLPLFFLPISFPYSFFPSPSLSLPPSSLSPPLLPLFLSLYPPLLSPSLFTLFLSLPPPLLPLSLPSSLSFSPTLPPPSTFPQTSSCI